MTLAVPSPTLVTSVTRVTPGQPPWIPTLPTPCQHTQGDRPTQDHVDVIEAISENGDADTHRNEDVRQARRFRQDPRRPLGDQNAECEHHERHRKNRGPR